MARIRTIKPEFWTNEDLASVSEAARLVAIGVLNQADDEGFFNANPKLLEAAIFPLTEPSMSIHECLIQLSKIGYLNIYSNSDGKKYGHVVKFTDHQRVNRPTPSRIKDLISFNESSVSNHGVVTEDSPPEGKGKEGKGKDKPLSSVDDCPHEKIIALYHEYCPTLSSVQVWNEKRKRWLKARWREDKKRQDLDWWKGYFQYVSGCPFLMGSDGKWQATLEWLINESNMIKVIEGNYESQGVGNG